MSQTYLFVPPEDNGQAQALGAQWDEISKCWYVGADAALSVFSRWLESAESDEEFAITSSAACVAAATLPCQRCHANIEVVCIHCHQGTVDGECLTEFTISDIWEMDETLAQQMLQWPNFHPTSTSGIEPAGFANHCPLCGAPQEEMDLHAEPDSPFFDIPRAAPGSIKLTPLTSTIQLSGNEHFNFTLD